MIVFLLTIILVTIFLLYTAFKSHSMPFTLFCVLIRLPLENCCSSFNLQCYQVVLLSWLCQRTRSFIHLLWVYLCSLRSWLWTCSSSCQILTAPLLSADDLLLLLCSSLQLQVFEEENRAAVRLLAGDNVEISRSLDPCSFNQFIPVDNFLHCRSDTKLNLYFLLFLHDSSSKSLFIDPR